MKREFEPSATMVALYDGRLLCGYLRDRRRGGCEAFTADGKSLGTFPNEDSASEALFQRERRT
jgi:hypothetical protein